MKIGLYIISTNQISKKNWMIMSSKDILDSSNVNNFDGINLVNIDFAFMKNLGNMEIKFSITSGKPITALTQAARYCLASKRETFLKSKSVNSVIISLII